MSSQNSVAEIQFACMPQGGRPKKTGPSDAPPSGNGRLPRVTQVMALAIQLQDMIQRGEARDYADLARLGCLTRERISQIMELVWLAPDIQQEIMEFRPSGAARFPISEVALRKVASLLVWEEQRQRWRVLKQVCHLAVP
jgi:hypothetical protein